MIPTEVLEKHLRQRIRRAGYALDDAEDLDTFAGRLRDLKTPDSPELFVVIRNFDLTTFLHGTLRTLSRLGAADLQDWYRQFTKTHFLAGQPAKLADVPWLHVSPDGSIGWALLQDPKQKMRLLRLLKRLATARVLELPDEMNLPGTSRGAQVVVRIAAGELPLETYLIHLNHLICEAFIEGALTAHDALRLRNVTRIDGWTTPPDAVRVHRGAGAPATFCAYGDLVRSSA